MYRIHIINRALGLLALAAILAMLLAACGDEEEPTAPAAAGQLAVPPTVEAMMEEATATPDPTPTATPIPEPTPVVLGDCRDGMRLQPGEGCRYTGGGSPQANVVLSVQHDGAICREGGPAKQEIGGSTINMDSLRLCVPGGFERDDAFQSDIVASDNADGSWTFYESALSASAPRSTATAGPTNTPTPAPPLNVYESGQTIPDFSSGIPNVVRGGASFQISGGGNVVITMANGGTVEYSHATYTCVSGEGCGIENGGVTTGTIRVADPSNVENPTPTPTAAPTRAQSASDRAVLVALYHSTGGASWDANTNWLSDRPIGEWHGVTTNSNGRVIKLDLPGNNLTGTLPAELGGLSNLTELGLYGNQLTGEIPPELGGLSNLTDLYLRLNQLTGCIPEGLRDIAENDLVELNLPDCGAAAPRPTATPGATAAPTPTPAPLLNVYESGQTIPDFPSGIPNVVRGGASLQIVGGNVVITMGNGGTVEYSHATYTCVSGGGCGIENGRVTTGTIRVTDPSNVESPTPIPTATPTRTQSGPDRAVLVALYHSTGGANWDANTNWLSDRPIGEWHGVTTNSNGRVVELNLFDNQLTGEIPPELGDLSNLTELWLSGTQLTGEIPPELGGLSNLSVLWLGASQLTGEIPPELGGLNLLLGSNGLTGEIPPELGRLSNLTVLWLGSNGLTGEIPPELGRLSNLTALRLGGSQWTGENPSELGRLSNLLFGSSQLTGEIPPELGRLSNLTLLWLSGNGLTGEIPPELGRLSNLTLLVLGASQLTGGIPPELGRLSNLTILSLYASQLTGGIPPELGGLSNLTILLLNNNQLTGEIPPELGGLSNLTHLGLGANQLTGCIPEGLRDIAENDLVELNLPDCGAATPGATPTPTQPARGECYRGLVVRPGESCTYPGSSQVLSVDTDGKGRWSAIPFLTFSGEINLNLTVNGREESFVARPQGDGSWIIEEAGGS